MPTRLFDQYSPLATPAKAPPEWGIPNALSPIAPPAAKEGAASEKIESRTRLQPIENGKPKFTPEQPVGQQFQMFPITRNFGTPTDAYLGFQGGSDLSAKNYQSTVSRPFAVGRGLVYDPTVVGGLRRTPTTLDEMIAGGISDANIQNILNPSYYHPEALPGRGGSVSPRTSQADLDQAALFKDPTYRAAWNAAREATDARFQAARSQLANTASRTGGFGSGEYLDAVNRLNAAYAKQKAQDILDAAAKANIGGGGTSFADSINSDSDVLNIQQTKGGLAGALASQIWQAKKKAGVYARDMETVQKSIPTFSKVQAQEQENIATFQERERQRRISEQIMDAFGVKNADVRTPSEAVNYIDTMAKATQMGREARVAQDLLRRYGINMPDVTTVNEAKAIIDRQLRANQQRFAGKALSPEEDAKRAKSFLESLFGEDAPNITNTRDAYEYARANARNKGLDIRAVESEIRMQQGERRLDLQKILADVAQGRLDETRAANLIREQQGERRMDIQGESNEIRRILADVAEGRLDETRAANLIREQQGERRLDLQGESNAIRKILSDVAQGRLDETRAANLIREQQGERRMDIKESQFAQTMEYKKQIRSDAKERFERTLELNRDRFEAQLEAAELSRKDKNRWYELAVDKAVDSSERAWAALESMREARDDLRAGRELAASLSVTRAKNAILKARNDIKNNAMELGKLDYDIQATKDPKGFVKKNPSFADWIAPKLEGYVKLVDQDGFLQSSEADIKALEAVSSNIKKKTGFSGEF